MATLLFTANSPGEIAGWLLPLAREARRRWPEIRVVVVLLPCTFASGAEARVARELVGADEVVPARRYLPLLLWEGGRHRPARLVHLGGDLGYAALLAWRWRLPAWAYLWGRSFWDGAFRGYFVKNAAGVRWLERKGIAPAKAHVVGDLVADSVALRRRRGAVSGPSVAFLPGSRLREVRRLAPFFLEVAARLAAERPDLRFRLLLSPFLEPVQLRAALESPPDPRLGGHAGRVEGGRLVGEGVALELVASDPLEALAAAQLAVTVPGTKTAEAGCLGVPMVMILPLNRPELLPYVGLLGLLDWIPGGARLKGRVLAGMKGKVGYLSQPNLLSGEEIVPEIVDVVKPEGVAAAIRELLRHPDRLRQQSERLKQLYAPSRGAAGRLLEIVEAGP